MKTTIYKYSSIASVIIVAFMIASTVMFLKMDNEPLSLSLGFAGMLIGFATIFLALENYKKKHGGALSFSEGFKIGLAIALIGSLSYTVVWMVEFQWFFPDFMDKFSASQIAQLKASNLATEPLAAEIAKVQAMAENYKNPFYRFGITLFEILPIGIFITLIAVLILRKQPKIVE